MQKTYLPIALHPVFFIPTSQNMTTYSDPSWVASPKLTCQTSEVWWSGIGSAIQFAPSTFLVSAAGFLDLYSPWKLQESPFQSHQDALSTWLQAHDQSPPLAPASYSQLLWDIPRIHDSMEAILECS